jgi:fido (protein-threonine AMPylation protein)
MRRQIGYPIGVATRSARGRKSREAIYRQLGEGVEELRARLGGLPSPIEAEDIWGDIWYQEAHNSTAIEGNTLVLREVELLLKEGRAVGNKQLAEYLEVQGYAEAAKWVYQQGLAPGDWTTGELITLTEVRHVHRLAMAKVWEVAPHPDATEREGPGSFREHNINPFPGGMQPPDWLDVQALMTDWVQRAGTLATAGEPLPDALSAVHAEFERIHPFLDGNGRAGRLVTNLLLIRLGYPPAIIRKAERTRYLEHLCRADAGDPGPLGEFLARAVLDTLMRFILPAVAGPARLVPLAALADGQLSARALRTAAERGRLRAQRDEHGQWRSTRRWVDEYRESRYKRV